MEYAVTHLDETLLAMWNTLSDSFINDVINGDAESRAKWGSYALTQAGLGLIGDKGISKVTTLAKGAKFAKVTKITAPLFLFFRNKILSFSLCQFYLLVFLNIKSKRII